VKLTLALAQMLYDSDINKNLQSIKAMIEAAESRDADILCFPECALSGYGPAHYTSSDEFDSGEIENALHEVRDYAQKHELNLVLGTNLSKGGSWYNAAMLISASGRLRGAYLKTHLTPPDTKFYTPGDEAKNFRFAGATVAVQICLDLRFPELFRILALEGAQVLFVPTHACGPRTRWKLPVIEAHLRSRAAENGLFLALVNAAGPYMNCTSMVVDPDGIVVAESNLETEELLVAEINLTQPRRMPDFLRIRRDDLVKVERPSQKTKKR